MNPHRSPIMPTHLLTVLWRPQASFQRLGGFHVGTLLACFAGIEFLLTLTILPYFVQSGYRMAAANPALTPGTRVFATAIAVAGVSLWDTLMIGACALLFLLLVRVLGGRAGYRDLAGMLVLASAPLLLGRAVRNISYALGYTASPSHSVLALDRIVPAEWAALGGRALTVVDIFDVWAFALVVAGFVAVAGLKRMPAALAGIAVWGMVQTTLIRMILDGGAA